MDPAPPPPPNPAGAAYWASAERALTIVGPVARGALLSALRTAGFRIETEQLTYVAGSRGSKFGASLRPDKLPMTVTVQVSDQPGGCTVAIQLRDRWPTSFGRRPGIEGAFRQAHEEIMTALDAALGRANPAARPQFSPPQYSHDRSAQPASSAAPPASVADRAARMWQGGTGTGTGAAIVSSKGVATFDVAALQMMSSVGTQIVSVQGSMPPNLAASVHQLIVLLEQWVPGASAGFIRVEIADDLIPVVDFLRQQARLRELVPLRTLERCSTCRLEKVVNPDYKKLSERNRKMRILGGGMGGMMSPYGLSPYVMIGKMVQLKQLDPDFVCPRCQGMQADTTIITFCSSCGDRRDEPVLRICPKCNHDFRRDLPEETLWQDEVAPPPPPVQELPAAPAQPWPTSPPVLEQPSVPAQPWPTPEPAKAPWSAPAATATPPPPPPAAQPAWTPTPTPPPPPGAGKKWWMPAAPAPTTALPAGWYADPRGEHEYRWWDGFGWTEQVR